MNNSNSNKNMDKFWFQIDDLLCFLFPQNLQHPLAASRLFIFGLYGPLDTEGRLRSGIGGNHVVSEYELEAMCEQTEREDLVQIYLHNPRQMGLLSTAEQDALINQADAKLKREKGKAMLPKLTRQDVIEILEVCIMMTIVKLFLYLIDEIIANISR